MGHQDVMGHQEGPEAGSSGSDTAAEGFDLDGRWALHPAVSLRPESFGALAYHFGNRKLSFLKDKMLVSVVEKLATAPSGREACREAGVKDDELGRYARALGALAHSEMLVKAS